jgi:hypothetical protein
MHPRGISELIYFGREEFWSARAEDCAVEMQKLHNRIKGQLQKSSKRYKSRVDKKIGEVNFAIGYQVLAHLRKDIFMKWKYKKLKMKNIGLCKILNFFVVNAYEIELPEDIRISPIFNVLDLYPYRMDDIEGTHE